MDYKEQLETTEWKEKREKILQRDNYHCQHCGKFGICGDDIYIPLHTINDIKTYIADEKLQKLIIDSFLELDNGVKTHDYNELPIIDKKIKQEKCLFYLYKGLNENLVSNSKFKIIPIISHDWIEKHSSWTIKDDRSYFSFPTCNRKNDWILMNKDKEFLQPSHGMKIEINNHTSISSYNVNENNNMEKNIIFLYTTTTSINVFFINIYIKDKHFTGYFYSNLCKQEYNFPILNIHHKSYITNHNAWEYENSNLITLCESCHQKEHEQHKILLLNENNKPLKYMHTCSRCGGIGYIRKYKHIQNGVCFNCGGIGVV